MRPENPAEQELRVLWQDILRRPYVAAYGLGETARRPCWGDVETVEEANRRIDNKPGKLWKHPQKLPDIFQSGGILSNLVRDFGAAKFAYEEKI